MTPTKLHRALREPLVHFLLIGAALFVLWEWRGGTAPATGGRPSAPETNVVVTQADLAQMEGQFVRTWQRTPTEEERRTLVEDFVRNEIYCREAIALGLDRDDAVLRRRLRQKMEFIYEDLASIAEPTDAELRAFLERHRENYLADPRLAFRQVYVDATRRGRGAEDEARGILAKLEAGADPETVGDSTMLAAHVPSSRLTDIGREFGDLFAESLRTLPPGRWSGPVRSGFGLHLVRIESRVEAELPEWAAVRETVRRDWIVARQQEVKDAAYLKLRERYEVTIEEPRLAAVDPVGSGNPETTPR